jgi:hypothetical protein
VTPIGWQQQLWSYRYGGLEGDCVVFQVSISNATHELTCRAVRASRPVADRSSTLAWPNLRPLDSIGAVHAFE